MSAREPLGADLFEPVEVGALQLTNRIVMAPMTRSRADDAGVPGELVPTYYAQRAGAGLILSEGTYPLPTGKGYLRTPGIHSAAQIDAWRRVTDAVHAAGGRIALQLMHAGRISDPSFLGGATPVAPSAVRPAGQSFTAAGLVPHVTPRALATSEIPAIVEAYAQAARNAMAAGFDAVELHAASGYLPEQFLSSKTNLRADAYGGSLANRARFVVEVLDALTEAVGRARVGMKIAPEMGFNDIADDTPQATYAYLVDAIAPYRLAWLHVALFGTPHDYHGLLRPRFNGAYFAGGGFDKSRAQTLLGSGGADAIVFGTPFIANPDLPERLRLDAPLAQPDRDTFYAPGAKGYVDYPALAP